MTQQLIDITPENLTLRDALLDAPPLSPPILHLRSVSHLVPSGLNPPQDGSTSSWRLELLQEETVMLAVDQKQGLNFTPLGFWILICQDFL